MKFVLSGIQTNNKGAELMLYAILQEIEQKWPDAEVYIPPTRIRQGLDYVQTSLDLRYTSSPLISKIFNKLHIKGIFNRLHLSKRIFAELTIKKDADWFIDGSGFAFGDQWNIKKESIMMWEYKLSSLKKKGSKIIFLPQAFGPVEKGSTRQALSVLNKYADVLMPREQVSYNYLQESGVVDMQKVKKYTDFTSLVEGKFPKEYEQLRNGICIIPNMQMIRKGKISYEDYIHLLSTIVMEGKKSGRIVYLLNHEGPDDAELCYKCKESIGGDIEAVTDLNALQVKGLIASAYMVVTSRFHGLASALNSCVPALATSWSHKYEELYRDYDLDGFVLPLDNFEAATTCVHELLDEKENQYIRQHLSRQVPKVKDETHKMWEDIWRI